jgi:hypothetical protein
MWRNLKAYSFELEDQRLLQPLIVLNERDPDGLRHRASISALNVFFPAARKSKMSFRNMHRPAPEDFRASSLPKSPIR